MVACDSCVCVQLGEHERALRLLVHKLNDFPAAENYCLINTSKSDIAERARLFHMLLSVYLDPSNEFVSAIVLALSSLKMIWYLFGLMRYIFSPAINSRGVYSIEAWMQPASLKKRGGNENHAYFRENWGEGN